MAKLNQTFHEQLGIPQGQMADFLGIHRVVLSDYERGRRPLPTFAAIKLNKLELAYLQQQKQRKPTKKTDDKVQQAKTAAQVKAYLKLHQVKSLRLESKLEKIKELHTGYTNLQQLMTTVLNDETSSSDDKTWADMFVRFATKKATLNGSHLQAVLQLKLDALQYQVTQATNFLTQHES